MTVCRMSLCAAEFGFFLLWYLSGLHVYVHLAVWLRPILGLLGLHRCFLGLKVHLCAVRVSVGLRVTPACPGLAPSCSGVTGELVL